MQINDNIYKLLGTFGQHGALNDRWRGYLKSFGLSGTNDDMLYTFLGYLGFTGSLNDRWKQYLQSTGGTFTGFHKLFLNFADGTDTLDPRITFSRATNATVTNSAGIITYAPHNLLTFSEQFDNAAWTKGNSTITPNAIAGRLGTLTADKLVEDSAVSNTHAVSQNLTLPINTTYTQTYFLKAAERTKVQLRRGAAGAFPTPPSALVFDLINGTYSGSLASGWTNPAITSEGNGWWKISITVTTSAAGSDAIGLYMCDSSGNHLYTGNGSSGVYIDGAQLEIGSTATTYNSTTVKNLLGYSELFDNAAWTKSNSFVQTNLLTYSEAFDNAAWSKTRATVTANAINAPNGTLTANKLIEDATASNTHINSSNSPAVVVSSVYTSSIYIKAAERSWFALYDVGAASGRYFNAATGAIGGAFAGTPTSSTITADGDGWYRASITCTATGTTGGVRTYLANADGGAVYTGDGASGIYIWGAQLVQGSVAGDYRRTNAAALPVYYPNHNGVVCAEKLVETTAAAANHRIDSGNPAAVVGTTYTNSFYVKAGERTWCILYDQGAVAGSYFDLANGVLGNTFVAAPLNSSITPVGNGWYRIAITCATGLTSEGCRLYVTTGNGVSKYTGDGTSGIYIWGAQLSDSASLDPYVLNAGVAPTAAAYYGARFDYDPVALEAKGLLIEEQRTNLLTYSEAFDNAAWTNQEGSVKLNATTAPDGTITADKYIANTNSTSTHRVFQGSASFVGSGITYTFSVYLKKAEHPYAGVVMVVDGTLRGVFVNLDTGVLTNQTNAPESSSIVALSDGWYRVSITETSISALGFVYVNQTNALSNTYQGDGTSGIYIFGAQLEAGAFATSYIPTAASQVTRTADVAEIRGSNFYSWFNQNEGSVYSNVNVNGRVIISRPITQFNDGSTNNNIQNYIYDNFFGTSVRSNATSQADVGLGAYVAGTNYKIASGYALNNVNGSRNGDIGTTDTSVILPNVINRLYIGCGAANNVINESKSNFLGGTIKSISYYNTRLPNSTLQGLTA